ncbi:MAG: AAA family ATPase [Patescibacteria group bacterium]|nr:AAA family ATPase [Patescibacteria group bacterium]
MKKWLAHVFEKKSVGQQLSLVLRPHALDDMVGMSDLAKWIRAHIKSKRVPKAWMFSGQLGSGKTSVARIIALSLQCRHGQFGDPCKSCRKKRESFDITEINVSEVTGIDGMAAAVSGAYYAPRPPSRYRVYILDEEQKASDSSQNMLLKYFEDTPPTTVFIICTTEPRKVLPTLRSRCVRYTMPPLERDGVDELVKRALVYAKKGEMTRSALVDALYDGAVTSPRLVVQAVERYLAGQPAERAAVVDSDSEVDTGRICRAMVRGKWSAMVEALASATAEDGRAIRASACSYMREMLLGEAEPGMQARVIADAIVNIARAASWDDTTSWAATVAELYRACAAFAFQRPKSDKHSADDEVPF